MYSFLLISLISLTYFFYQGLGFGPSRYNFIIELFLIIYLFLIIKLIKKIINPTIFKIFYSFANCNFFIFINYEFRKNF